jgi:myo-inositol-1(or 4)-monophosphatase
LAATADFSIDPGYNLAAMEDFETVAREAVAAAGAQLRLAAGRARHVELKGAVDLVTATDREVEALIIAHLHAAFPDHLIIAEESTGTSAQRPPAGAHAWYIDPLDGTTNFAHGLPHFAVSLALARGDEMLLGIVQDPLRQETFVARRGAGATLNGRAIRTSATKDLGSALLATGFPYDRREHANFYLSFVADFVRRSRDVRRIGSAALDLCYVACGRFDAFWEWHLKPWDTAAGTLIVSEAGGTVSDFRGAAFDAFGTQTLASNGRIHAALVEALVPRLGAGAPAEHPPGS